MTYSQSIELTRGHKEYDSKLKNIEGIFSKLRGIFNISKYENELEIIKSKLNKDNSFQKVMPFSEMQMDYEGFAYKPYIREIEKLTKNLEEELLPFYELYLLKEKIEIQIKDISEENINEIIENTRTLITSINNLNTHNIPEKNTLIEECYKVIYLVILYEELFERDTVLAYVNKLNIEGNKENIGRLVSQDLDKINREELIDEDIRTIKKEGLGYDYLNRDIIRKISQKTVGKTNSEYQERKRKTVLELSEKAKSYTKEKDLLMKAQQNNSSKIRNLRISKALLGARALSLILVPVITFSVGKSLGKKASDKIYEYKTITRTVDLNTGKLIGTPEEIYDEKETTYVATVTIYNPWRKNPAGMGYIRNATAYTYITPEDAGENYHATKEELEENTIEKYKFVESKDKLDENDSTENYMILLTETYQDKNDKQKSKKYIIPLALTGAFVGLVLDVILYLLKVSNISVIKELLDDLNYDIKQNKLTNDEIKEKLIKMKEDVLLLQDSYNDAVKKYGDIGDQFITSEIDTSWLIKDKNKRKMLTK